MDLNFLIMGLILGFSVAAPVGHIGILCINRTIKKSYISGLTTGLGAASADLIYGLIAGFGLTFVSNFLLNQKFLIQSFGLVFLFYLGFKTIFVKKPKDELRINNKGLIKDYLSTFILTISNPVTILFFIAVFAGLGLTNIVMKYSSTALFVFGVFVGSTIWWLILNGITHKLKKQINESILDKIDLFSGLIIFIFGFLIVTSSQA